MPKFVIDCQWIETGEMEVEADTLEQAMEDARNNRRLPEGEYLEDSFQVNEDVTRELNVTK